MSDACIAISHINYQHVNLKTTFEILKLDKLVPAILDKVFKGEL